MADPAARSGRCLCGAVRFSAVVDPHMHVCHCGFCRRWSGGAFMAVGVSDLRIADESALGVYKSSDYGERVFCKTCGSSLFWRMQDGSMTVASLQAFDDQSGVAFAQQIFVDSKPAAYEFANPTKKLTGAEFFAAFAGEGSGQ